MERRKAPGLFPKTLMQYFQKAYTQRNCYIDHYTLLEDKKEIYLDILPYNQLSNFIHILTVLVTCIIIGKTKTPAHFEQQCIQYYQYNSLLFEGKEHRVVIVGAKR